MNFLDAVILGIVEGITEFLPISSTGHLILTGRFLDLPQSEFLKTFEIAIQLGAILSVAVIYFKSLFADRSVMTRIALAFAPTAVLGALLYKIVKTVFLESDRLIAWSLLIGGIVIILFEWRNSQKAETREGKKQGSEEVPLAQEITLQKSFWIGVFQSLAMIPGVSRSGATIIGGMSLGISRKNIVEFSFLLAFPTMLAATLLDIWKSRDVFTEENISLLAVGFAVSFVVAWAAIKFFLNFIKRNTFTVFGIYRIVIGVLLLLFFL